MPRTSCWFIRTALVYLALGFTLGALLLWQKGRPISPLVPRLLPAHVEFLLVGWMVQLAIGVATWIFPRFGVRRSARGSTAAAWAVFALLNAGVWLAALGPLVAAAASARLTLVGRLAEGVAAAVFAAHVWTRVRRSGLSEL